MTDLLQEQPASLFEAHIQNCHGPNWMRWLGHLAGQPNATGVELGTFRGNSAEWMAKNIFTHASSSYWTVDTYQGSEEHQIWGTDFSTIEQEARDRLAKYPNVYPSRGESHVFLHWAYDHAGLRADAGYIDAAHDSMNVLRDSVLMFDLLRAGGVMIWDDYNWTRPDDPIKNPLDYPQLAIDSFLACYARHYLRLPPHSQGLQVAIQKL